MSSKSSKNGAYKILVTQKGAITKITGIITPESIDTLKNELGGAITILKSTHFAKGATIRVPHMPHTEGAVPHHHRRPNVGIRGTGQSRCMRSHSP